MKAEFLYNPEKTDKIFCHAPTLLVSRSGDLLGAWYFYSDKEHMGASLALARKADGEDCWGKSRTVFGGIPYSVGNPVLFELPQGIVWLLFVVLKGGYWDSCEIQGAYSWDMGRTWSRPDTLWNEKGVNIRHPPIQRRDGSLLLPVYNEKNQESFFLRSSDPGKGWEKGFEFKGYPLIQPTLVRTKETSLTAFFRPATSPNRIWRSHSNDEGLTWANPIQTLLPNPLSGISSFSFGNTIALIHNPTDSVPRTPLGASISRDYGITWENHWNFEQIRYEVSYPSFNRDRSGMVHGLYTYNRKMIKYVSFEEKELIQKHVTAYGTRISDFKGIHKGKRVFILASGPSLSNLNLSPLKRRITMGLNRSGLLFPETQYHCVMDERLFDEFGDILHKSRVLFTLDGRPWGIPLKLLGSEGFSWDLEEGIYTGYTIAFFALQLAVYMGFNEVYFLGLDLKHGQGKTHFFGSDYHSRDHENTEFPKMNRMMSYGAKILENSNVKVFNCSPDSTLTCFNKVSYDYAISL